MDTIRWLDAHRARAGLDQGGARHGNCFRKPAAQLLVVGDGGDPVSQIVCGKLVVLVG